MKIRLFVALGIPVTTFLLIGTAVAVEGTEKVETLLQQNKLPLALSEAETLVLQNPRLPQPRFLQGVILARLGRKDEAQTIFLKLTKDFPNLPEPYNNLAVLYTEQGKYEQARQTLESAMQAHPSYAAVHRNLGEVYGELSRQAYAKALQVDRKTPQPQTARLTLLASLSSVNDVPGDTPRARQLPTPSQTVASVTPLPPAPVVVREANTEAAKPASSPAAPPPVALAAATSPAQTRSVSPQPPATVEKPAPTARLSADAGITDRPPQKPPVVPAPQTAAVENRTERPAAVSETREKTTESVKTTEKAVIQTVQDWAKAWSNKDVKAYLAFYSKDFVLPAGHTRSSWAQERQQRLTRPGAISITLENIKVSLNGHQATVQFRQYYRANNLNRSTDKTLELVRTGSQWQIRREQAKG